MGKIIKYRYHQFTSRPMNIGIMVGNTITSDNGIEFVKRDGIYAIMDEDDVISNDRAYNIDLLCYEKVGTAPYHLCYHKGRVYVLYGRIEYDTMKILCIFTPTEDGKGYESSFVEERFNVSGVLVYDGHCNEVENMFSAYISEMFLKRLPIKKVSEKDSYVIGDNNEIYISAYPGAGFSYSTMVKYDMGDSNYSRMDIEERNYLTMLNTMYMATTDGKKTCTCDFINMSLNAIKASTVSVNGMLAASIANSLNCPISECWMGIFNPIGNYAFISDFMREKFKEYDFWFTPDMIAIAALRLVKRLENSIKE